MSEDNVVPHPAARRVEHTFDRAILDFLPEAMAVATDRGSDYGDTWALENRVNTFKKIVLRLPGHPDLFGEWMRLWDCAALIDTKHTRYLGGYKRDHIIDGINYEAMFGHLMEDFQQKLKTVTTPPPAIAEATLPEAQ